MSQYILSIDEGTTGVTALIVEISSQGTPNIIAKHTTDFRQIFPDSGWVEHDLNDIWHAARTSVLKVLELTAASCNPRSLAAIGLTNQRETICVFDRKTSSPICNAIVWQCRRSTKICEELKLKGLEHDVRIKTGLVLDPYFSGTKISWLMKNNPQVKEKLTNGSAICGTIDTYLLHRLTGGLSFATEPSNASRTLLMNLKGHWDRDMLDLLEIPSQSILPEIRSSADRFGVTKGLDFLPDGIPITGMLGDQQAALAGQTCFGVGEAKCTYGTGAFLLMNTGKESVLSKSGLLTTVAWGLKGELTYALEGSCFIAGAAIQFLRDQLKFLAKSDESEAMASQVEASPNLYFVPALSGLGAPYWDPKARGAFLGLHRGSTTNEIVRASLEGIGFQVMDLTRSMTGDLGRALSVLRVDGGAAKNNLLMQFQADLIEAPVDRPANIETTAMGAALFSALGVGIFSDLDQLKSARVQDRLFSPCSNLTEKASLILKKKGWAKAVQAVQLFAKE